MASLTGNSIDTTYQGLIKTISNAPLAVGLRQNITDGAGNPSTLYMAQDSASFNGTLDLSTATVIGLASGLADSTGTFSMASTLTDQPGVASGYASVAIGRNSDATADSAIAIGNYSDAVGSKAVAIGSEVYASGDSIAMGWTANAQTQGIAIGKSSEALSPGATALGIDAHAKSANTVCVGNLTTAFASQSIVIGTSATDADGARVNSITIGNNVNTAQYTVNIGNGQNAYGADGVCIGNSNTFGGDFNISIGYGNNVSVYNTQGAIGYSNTSQLTGSYVIGNNLTAVWENATHVNQLAMLNYTNLNYADDTAAAAGGVPLSGLYHNAGALRVRVA